MLTIKDILTRPLFQSARLVAGEEGQVRAVKWVHIGEIPHLSQFLKGGELVLSTGVGLADASLRRTFIEGLIQAGAAGLVLELGSYFSDPPEDLLFLAAQKAFPVIVFPHAVRFLDLSYEINTLIISEHHHVLEELESLSLRIRQVLLNTEGPEALVRTLYGVTREPIWYRRRFADQEDLVWGEWTNRPPVAESPALHPTVEQHQGSWWVRQSVMVFDNPVGDLYVEIESPILEERLYLALDRVAAALAQDFIREETLQKSQRREEAVMLQSLFFQEPLSPAVLRRFDSRYGLNGAHRYRVGMTAPSTYARLRHTLQTPLLALEESDRTLLILLARPPAIDHELQRIEEALRTANAGESVGWSRLHAESRTIREALLEAHGAWMVSRLRGQPRSLCYDALGIYRWVLATERSQLHGLLIEPELRTVLLMPRAARDNLLDTLEVVVSGASKSEAANQLGIHRQTLYTRLKRLESVLGADFLSPHRRTAIHAAILALRFLESAPEDRRAPPS